MEAILARLRIRCVPRSGKYVGLVCVDQHMHKILQLYVLHLY